MTTYPLAKKVRGPCIDRKASITPPVTLKFFLTRERKLELTPFRTTRHLNK